jgi:ribosomal protein L32
MPGSFSFTDNYTDLSNEDGYQFEFRCERCGNGYRSAFTQDKRARSQRFIRGISGVLSGTKIFDVANAADRMLDRNTNSAAKDRAFAAAVEELSSQFHQCRGCGEWVCGDVCWNNEVGQCANCSPRGSEQLAQQQAIAREIQFRDQLEGTDLTSGYRLAATSTTRCPGCGTQVDGGKFCPECGTSLVAVNTCAKCSTENPVSARFCSECGNTLH